MSFRQVSKEGKNLLKHTIKFQEFQNKKKEEELMWQKHELRTKNLDNDDSQDAHVSRNKRKHDDSYGYPSGSNSDSDNKKYWLNKLIREESKQPDRWDHSGFKELYPEEFGSSSSSSSSEPKKKTKKKKKKRKKKKRSRSRQAK